jgi:hypothetical protein
MSKEGGVRSELQVSRFVAGQSGYGMVKVRDRESRPSQRGTFEGEQTHLFNKPTGAIQTCMGLGLDRYV